MRRVLQSKGQSMWSVFCSLGHHGPISSTFEFPWLHSPIIMPRGDGISHTLTDIPLAGVPSNAMRSQSLGQVLPLSNGFSRYALM